jgi:hypothetical protein
MYKCINVYKYIPGWPPRPLPPPGQWRAPAGVGVVGRVEGVCVGGGGVKRVRDTQIYTYTRIHTNAYKYIYIDTHTLTWNLSR